VKKKEDDKGKWSSFYKSLLAAYPTICPGLSDPYSSHKLPFPFEDILYLQPELCIY
jgi:hypothetical protein